MMPHAMAGDADQPVPKAAATHVEAVKPLDGQEPYLLAHVFGGAPVSTHEMIDQPEHVADVTIVHGGPRCPIAPGHLT